MLQSVRHELHSACVALKMGWATVFGDVENWCLSQTLLKCLVQDVLLVRLYPCSLLLQELRKRPPAASVVSRVLVRECRIIDVWRCSTSRHFCLTCEVWLNVRLYFARVVRCHVVHRRDDAK